MFPLVVFCFWDLHDLHVIAATHGYRYLQYCNTGTPVLYTCTGSMDSCGGMLLFPAVVHAYTHVMWILNTRVTRVVLEYMYTCTVGCRLSCAVSLTRLAIMFISTFSSVSATLLTTACDAGLVVRRWWALLAVHLRYHRYDGSLGTNFQCA